MTLTYNASKGNSTYLHVRDNCLVIWPAGIFEWQLVGIGETRFAAERKRVGRSRKPTFIGHP